MQIKLKKAYLVFGLMFMSAFARAQCAMCRAVLESEAGQSSAEGVNNGIVYLMSIPYILVLAVGAIIYFKFFRKRTAKIDSSL